MSFNRRGGGRPDRSFDRDRAPRRGGGPPGRGEGGGGDWQRERPRDRPYGDRPYSPRGGPRFDRSADEGGMSLRLDPRRLQALKRFAAEEGVRPGDLVRQWVEERIDAARGGASPAATGGSALLPLIQALEARVTALETAAAGNGATPAPAEPAPPSADVEPAATAEPAAAPGAAPARATRGRRNAVSAAPAGQRVALHDEMIAVLRERGPMTARELAAAVAERGRYTPPRSGKPLDAAMVSQRVSNPTYRSRFTRNEGRIGLTESEATGGE